MIPPLELMNKLGLRSGDRLWLINAPREMAEELAAGAEVEMVHEADEKDGIIAFFDSATEAEAVAPRILEQLPDGGRLWIGGGAEDVFANSGWTAAETIDLGSGQSLQRFARK